MSNKRGPKVGNEYRIVGQSNVSAELDDLARRRTQALLDTTSMQTRPLALLLKEAWLIGVKDGVVGCGKEIDGDTP